MRYLGGKYRFAARIVQILSPFLPKASCYLEPFVGGASVIARIDHPIRLAGDSNPYLIALYQALQEGWQPPESVSEDQYHTLEAHKDDNPPLTGFVGFGCSFGGKWFGGYARTKREEDFCGESRRSLLRNYAGNAAHSLCGLQPGLQDVVFRHLDYEAWDAPRGAVIYADPPYQGTTSYKGTGTFDHTRFWQVMRRWSIHHTVVISEYTAPDDFTCIAQFPSKSQVRTTSPSNGVRIERLFRYSGCIVDEGVKQRSEIRAESSA